MRPVSSSRTGILTGAALAVAALERAGVEVAFGLPGVHNLSLWRGGGGWAVRVVGGGGGRPPPGGGGGPQEQGGRLRGRRIRPRDREARRRADHDRSGRGQH